MRVLFFCFFIFSISFTKIVSAQTKSGNPEKISFADNVREVEHLLKLAERGNSKKNALENLQKAAHLADTINFKEGKATALRYIGNYYSDNSDSTKALTYYRQSLKICEQINDKKNLVKVLENIGILYGVSLDYPKSIRYYLKAIGVTEKINDNQLLARLYGDCGRVFYQNLDFPKAFQYYRKASDIYEKSGNKDGKIVILQNIGELYYHLEEFDKTLDCATEIISLSKATGNKMKTAFAYAWRGNVLMNSGKYKESLLQYDASVNIRKEINDEEGLAGDYANLACIHHLLSHYETALKYHNACYALVQKTGSTYTEMLYLKDMGWLIQDAPDSILARIGIRPEERFRVSLDYEEKAMQIAATLGDTPQKTYILKFMILAYEKLGNYKEAYAAYQKLTDLENAMTGQQIKSDIARKDAQFFFEKKEAAEKIRNEKNKASLKLRYSILLSVLFIVAVIGFSLFYYIRMKKKKEKKIYAAHLHIAELEKEKAESELNRAKADMKQFVLNLNQKNALIDKISKELLRLNHALDEEKTVIQSTLNEIKSSVILTDKDWKTFLIRFEKIHPDFIAKLKLKYPKITTSELRYLMLIKIGLSNKEMADLLGVSPNTIIVTWKRLREKLGFSKEESPQSILNLMEDLAVKTF